MKGLERKSEHYSYDNTVTIKELSKGSGGVYLVSGIDHEQVRAKAQEIRKEIDFMRSPTISESIQNTGELLCEVKYYGLD